jgi:phosphatidylglycerol---prolipoprotein diacylglyceryl transferase
MSPLALIPWFKLEGWQVSLPVAGSFEVQPFGLLAALAILVGSHFAARRADELGLGREVFSSFAMWTTAVGLVSAYVLNIAMYHPELIVQLAREPARLTRHWYGLSSYGGFIGGTICAVVFARVRKTSLTQLGDAWCYGIPFAWVFARMGCFVVHDHPGVPSDFLLAVDDYNRTGIARHDLGLYEVLWSLAVCALFLRRSRRPREAGYYLAAIPALYGPVRFALDFLRADVASGGDVRYLGLTPAQYLSLALALTGCVLWLRLKMHGAPFARSGAS